MLNFPTAHETRVTILPPVV